jgi:hypothetical protein
MFFFCFELAQDLDHGIGLQLDLELNLKSQKEKFQKNP